MKSIEKPKDPAYESMMMEKYEYLVRYIAGFYRYLGELEDILQDGRFGLLYAIRYYDENTGVPFHKLAQLCIRTFILKSYFRCGKTVRNGDGFGNNTKFEFNFDCYEIEDEEEQFTGKYDSILTAGELDSMVLNKNEYMEMGHSTGYLKNRRSAKKKIKEIENIYNKKEQR